MWLTHAGTYFSANESLGRRFTRKADARKWAKITNAVVVDY